MDASNNEFLSEFSFRNGNVNIGNGSYGGIPQEKVQKTVAECSTSKVSAGEKRKFLGQQDIPYGNPEDMTRTKNAKRARSNRVKQAKSKEDTIKGLLETIKHLENRVERSEKNNEKLTEILHYLLTPTNENAEAVIEISENPCN